MRITHKLPKLNISGEGDGAFMLSNQQGSFLLLSPSASKHNGLFIKLDKMYKILDNISLIDYPVADSLENVISFVRRSSKDASEVFVMPIGANGLFYHVNKKAEVALDFDVREVNDFRQFGRLYECRNEGEDILVSFKKMSDKREDGDEGKIQHEAHVRIRPINHDAYANQDSWHEVSYPLDNERKDPPSTRWVYRPFTLKSRGFYLAVGSTEAEAAQEMDAIVKDMKRKTQSTFVTFKKSKQLNAAFICAQDSLRKLYNTDEKRLSAGYPWFWHYWSRDELISLKGLSHVEEGAERLILRYLAHVKDGRLPNRVPSSELGSADSIGWLFCRASDFIDRWSLEEKETIKAKLEATIDATLEKRFSDGLVQNGPLETWMDTFNEDDTRAGARIEIQALFLGMLKFARELGQDRYVKIEADLKEQVRKNFFDGSRLLDSPGDKRVRPNMFIAYYAYPGLLKNPEWEKAFDNALEELWLDWGALSTIGKKDRLFVPEYSGIDNASYHRGDSWFWINNLAGICMHRLDKVKYSQKIDSILKSSAQDILWKGAAGHASELSSAKEQKGQGCLVQAWSAAMFIELMLEVIS